MVTKAHRGMIHIPRRGRGGGRRRPPRPPVRRMVTRVDPVTDRRMGGVRRPTVDPKRPRRPTVNQQITAKAAPEFGTKEYNAQLDKFMKENAAKVAELNQARLAKITTDAKERIANEKAAKQVALQNKVKNNPNIKMPESIRQGVSRGIIKFNKGGMLKKGHNDMRKGGLFY